VNALFVANKSGRTFFPAKSTSHTAGGISLMMGAVLLGSADAPQQYGPQEAPLEMRKLEQNGPDNESLGDIQSQNPCPHLENYYKTNHMPYPRTG
jgi:hypothetical protein